MSSQERAEYLSYKDHLYDALLGEYEPDATSAQINTLFADLKPFLIDLTKQSASDPRSPPPGPYPYVSTPLCDSISLGVHESQSRFWEVIIGQSRSFWEYAYPKLKETFPQRLPLQRPRALQTSYRLPSHLNPLSTISIK